MGIIQIKDTPSGSALVFDYGDNITIDFSTGFEFKPNDLASKKLTKGGLLANLFKDTIQTTEAYRITPLMYDPISVYIVITSIDSNGMMSYKLTNERLLFTTIKTILKKSNVDYTEYNAFDELSGRGYHQLTPSTFHPKSTDDTGLENNNIPILFDTPTILELTNKDVIIDNDINAESLGITHIEITINSNALTPIIGSIKYLKNNEYISNEMVDSDLYYIRDDCHIDNEPYISMISTLHAKLIMKGLNKC